MTGDDPRSTEPSRMRTRLSPHTRAGPAAAPSTPTPQPKRKRRRFGSMSPSWPGFRRAFTRLDLTGGRKFRGTGPIRFAMLRCERAGKPSTYTNVRLGLPARSRLAWLATWPSTGELFLAGCLPGDDLVLDA